jgi:hypothetical protein
MIFSWKKKQLHIDCFTNRPDLYSLLPVTKSNKAFPAWWKDLPKVYDSNVSPVPLHTMKSCVGFTEYFKNSFYIPFWTDAHFSVSPGYQTGLNYAFADGTTTATVHPVEERGTFLDPNKYQHLKIHSPWAIECKEDIKFLFNQNTWCFTTPEEFIIPPGIVDFKYQKNTNYNLFLPYTGQSRNVFISAGSPIVTYFPMTEKEVVIHNHLLDDIEFKKRREANSAIFSFGNRYRLNKSLMDSKKSCPFH